MLEGVFTGYEGIFLFQLALSLVFGLIIGAEREMRGKVAGISTQCFVIAGAMFFTFLSGIMEPNNPSRIAAQIVTGIGFLGAGIILKGEHGKITNVTTAASIWFTASIGMAIGFGWYAIAALSTIYAILVPRIPSISNNPKLAKHIKNKSLGK